MNKQIINFAGITLAILLTALAIVWLQEAQTANASAPSGLPVLVATSSTRVIGPTVSLNGFLFGTTTNEAAFQCSSRIISTRGESAIMLSLASLSSTTLSGSIGTMQSASTTVAYDSGLYGCGYVTAFAYATTTVTLVETR